MPDGRRLQRPLVRDGLPRRRVRAGAAGDRAVALRYGATDWAVYRYNDDRYKFQQLATFEDAAGYTLYWNGPEFAAWRADYAGWYQVPVVYAPMRLVASGRIGAEPNGNGGLVSPARAEPSSAPRR